MTTNEIKNIRSQGDTIKLESLKKIMEEIISSDENFSKLKVSDYFVKKFVKLST